jgi:hypothetical protein
LAVVPSVCSKHAVRPPRCSLFPWHRGRFAPPSGRGAHGAQHQAPGSQGRHARRLCCAPAHPSLGRAARNGGAWGQALRPASGLLAFWRRGPYLRAPTPRRRSSALLRFVPVGTHATARGAHSMGLQVSSMWSTSKQLEIKKSHQPRKNSGATRSPKRECQKQREGKNPSRPKTFHLNPPSVTGLESQLWQRSHTDPS